MNRELVLFHLTEAKEELGSLALEAADPEFDENSLLYGLQHAYHHLNSSWNGRNYDSREEAERSGSGACVRCSSYADDANAPDDVYQAAVDGATDTIEGHPPESMPSPILANGGHFGTGILGGIAGYLTKSNPWAAVAIYATVQTTNHYIDRVNSVDNGDLGDNAGAGAGAVVGWQAAKASAMSVVEGGGWL